MSVVVTAYRRVDHLERTVTSFLANCTWPEIELVLCDDGSPTDVQHRMRELPFDVFVFGERNRGLGSNLNRGLRIARGEYVLYLQDDWVCTRRCDFVQEALDVFEEHPDIGLLRLTAPNRAYQREEIRRTRQGREIRVPTLGEEGSYEGIYVYSDNPHIKRKDLHEKVGYFAEDLRSIESEDEFCRRFLASSPYKVALVKGHEGLFVHIGEDLSYATGRGRWRKNLRTRLRRNTLTRGALSAYDALPEPVRHVLRGRLPPRRSA